MLPVPDIVTETLPGLHAWLLIVDMVPAAAFMDPALIDESLGENCMAPEPVMVNSLVSIWPCEGSMKFRSQVLPAYSMGMSNWNVVVSVLEHLPL